MDEGLRYILDLLEAEEVEDADFVRQARSIGLGDFELAQVLVDEYSDEACVVPNANTTLWRREFCADAPFNGRVTGWYESKLLAFDAALEAVAYRFDLTLPEGSGRCRQAA